MLETLNLAAIPPEDEALREPVRAFLAERLAAVSAARRARTWMGYDADFTKALAEKGWVGLTLPQDYGGQARSPFARFVLIEELLAAGAPVAAHWIAERQSAPLILRYGTEEQKRRIVPAVCRGEAFFCIGMSEPNSGSDLASVRSRADRVDGGWKLSGTKIWTTYGHKAHFMIALVRTSGAPEDRNNGLSQFLIDLKAPGVTARPIRDLAGDEHFSEVHFDDAILPEDALLGQEGAGWEQVNAELAFERSGPERIYSSTVLVDAWLDYLRGRGNLTDAERVLAGRLLAELSALRNMSLSVTAMLAAGKSPVVEASVVKDLGTGFEQSIPTLIADHLAGEADGVVPAELLATVEYLGGMCPTFSLRGGTREILRGIIARGLGLR
ncbi:acyl-CoA dehydrogenase family protein [Phenylobacterium sp. J426]|uniref:acyl-CoA dehydrogenase family protein n=1 Tax=Phenylobacterium sp. J426 TaxID=2898439 RepID=UPI0021506E78|nr:acyl-CoA dehydrogenase family protein [Phenylobacterium sp. J426]MCR5875418.1 acyl-CoA dehydrogenase family protein [Phenylobacterium sp. J426]